MLMKMPLTIVPACAGVSEFMQNCKNHKDAKHCLVLIWPVCFLPYIPTVRSYFGKAIKSVCVIT